MIYNIFKYLFRFLFLFVYRIRIQGQENIPEEGAFIVIANHKSNFDPIVLSFITRRPIHFMAKAELFDSKIKKWLFTSVKTIKVERGKNDISAIKNSLKVLKRGDILGIFPEGTRVKDHLQKDDVKSGAVMMAHRAKVNILPVAISGNYRPFSTVNIQVLPLYNIALAIEEGMDYEHVSDDLMKKVYEWS